MGHDWFSRFDRDVCEGTHPDVDGVCPLKDEGLIDRCGECGCTLVGLDMTNSPPDGCIRSEHHKEKP